MNINEVNDLRSIVLWELLQKRRLTGRAGFA